MKRHDLSTADLWHRHHVEGESYASLARSTGMTDSGVIRRFQRAGYIPARQRRPDTGREPTLGVDATSRTQGERLAMIRAAHGRWLLREIEP